MDFAKFVKIIDRAIEKINQHLPNLNPNAAKHLSDKKDLLQSILSIMKSLSENYNYNSPNEPKVTMLEHVRRLVIKLMKNRLEKNHVGRSQSSDESESSQFSEQEDNYDEIMKVIHDYESTDIQNCPSGGISKSLNKKLNGRTDLDIQNYARIYREISDDCKRKLDGQTSIRKMVTYTTRQLFCEVADTCLRSASSTSHLERMFGDCVRSIEGRRHKLRKVLIKSTSVDDIDNINIIKIMKSSSHVSIEGFLRSLDKALPNVIQLAESMNYKSSTLDEMAEMIPKLQKDEEEFGEEEFDEEVIYS